jgi:hypothetical protein
MRVYLIGTGVASLLALVVTGFVTAALGADSRTLATAEAAMLLGCLVSFAPAVVGGKLDIFGMAVLAASVARLLTAMAIVVVASAAMQMPRAPLGVGVGAGLLLALIAEVVLALSVLSRVNASERVTA